MKAMKRYKEGDYLFDGFAHRPYNEQTDGWRNAIPDPADYPAVQQANAVLDVFEPLCDFYVGSPVSEEAK
jgi:hypothetical protein